MVSRSGDDSAILVAIGNAAVIISPIHFGGIGGEILNSTPSAILTKSQRREEALAALVTFGHVRSARAEKRENREEKRRGEERISLVRFYRTKIGSASARGRFGS
jgi:hypothetical protein